MAFVLTCQQIGIRGARLLLGLSNAQYYRFKADAKKLEQNYRCPRFRVLASINAQLKEFIPVIRDDIVDQSLVHSKHQSLNTISICDNNAENLFNVE